MSCSNFRTGPALIAALTLMSFASRARAQDPACIKAYEDVQVLRRESHVIAARDAAVACASSCPPVLAKDCATWIGELQSAIPRVVLDARDGNGTPVVNVQVTIDGKPAVQQLQGRAIEVDPGPRTFVFSTAGAASVRLQTVVVEFEKNQRVSAQFTDLFPQTRNAPLPTVAWVFAGVSVVAIANAAVFGTMAWSLRQDLEQQDCAPACPGSDVASLARLTTVTDVSLGIGITAAAGAVAVWLVTRPPPPRKQSNLSLHGPWSPHVFAVPTPDGARLNATWIW